MSSTARKTVAPVAAVLVAAGLAVTAGTASAVSKGCAYQNPPLSCGGMVTYDNHQAVAMTAAVPVRAGGAVTARLQGPYRGQNLDVRPVSTPGGTVYVYEFAPRAPVRASGMCVSYAGIYDGAPLVAARCNLASRLDQVRQHGLDLRNGYFLSPPGSNLVVTAQGGTYTLEPRKPADHQWDQRYFYS